MNHTKSILNPSFKEAFFILLGAFGVMSGSIILLEAPPHLPIISALILLILYGLINKVPFKELEQGITQGAQSGLGAVFLFFMIGILLSSWILSGTIPTLMYVGFELTALPFFYAIVFLICAIVGVGIGSAFTTASTIGLAFIGIAGSIDGSLAITAGAIISGAFFGDKMSPLSDTTNLASGIVKVDLFEHIKNMMWTTVPAFLISFIIFAVLSPDHTSQDLSAIEAIQSGLLEANFVHWSSFIPMIILAVLAIKKIHALITLNVSSFSAILLGLIHQKLGLSEVFNILFAGYVSNTGNDAIDSLLSRGGLNSMMFTVSLVILALGLGGLLFKLGIIQSVLVGIKNWLRSQKSTILTSVSCAMGINLFIGEQYLSILLTGEAFAEQYEKQGIARKHLSRVLEDAGTVVNPLVPWSVCGVFLTSILGVSTLAYLPFAFFCLLCPVLTILYAVSGFTVSFRNEDTIGKSVEV
ncbi:transporter (NhaC family) [Bacillus oleivorans]|uniref:Transporter (NhaC family) n=1 Tax=Bacillus oleivorans TaxID=1448271 RepID=A0A285D8L2_9BACI|nr:Na+/H+ antiporter NhaC [Bacillus oleivorans]SNX75676.1 transporter (NhaC family) [Bacillus oleivorans]